MDTTELRDTWLRSLARERGYTVLDTDSCSLELELEGDGCCDMCYSERAVMVVQVGTVRFSIYDY